MKLKLAVASITALSSIAIAAQPLETQPMLRASSEGQYEVWCKITPTSGEETTRYLQPGRDALGLSKVRRAECNYKAGSSGPVTVSVTGSDWACPFAVAADGTCQSTFNKASFGSFNLKRKPH